MDRSAVILPDGTFVAGGARGFEAWEAGSLEEARSRGRWVREIPERLEWIAVQSPFLCCQRSSDGGRTWERREGNPIRTTTVSRSCGRRTEAGPGASRKGPGSGAIPPTC